jgi:plasmid stabilization system protein ParE
MPYRHEVIPESEDLGIDYRQLLLGNYRTIYRIENERVIVLRIVHAARLLDLTMLTVHYRE